MPDHNLYTLFDHRFAAAGERAAFRGARGEVLVTYRGLREAVGRYANALAVLGLEPGERVAVQVRKSLASVALSLAIIKAGGVLNPLNPAYTPAEVDYFVGDAEPRIIVCDPLAQADMRALADRRKVTAVVNLDAAGAGSFNALAARMDSRHETVPRQSDDLAGLIYTSGTTGKSKGAMITHGNLSTNALALHELWGFSSQDVLLHALPIFHVHGLYVALNTAFLSVAEILWFETFDADAVIDALAHASVMMGVPTFYTRLLASPRLTPAACRAVRLFISGSAPLLPDAHAGFAGRTGHAILERYGMTETGMIASNPYAGERVAGTVGFALPGVEVRIADQEGRELPRTKPGMVEVKGPNVFRGYWRAPDKTAQDMRPDGFFITGDVGVMDDTGRVTIIGRAKDVIITGGFNVYPKEIEEELDRLPGIVESAVIGVPHSDFGEGVVAVVTTGEAQIDEADVIAALSARLARFKIPKRVFAVDALPRNAMGKVQKAELRHRYAEIFTPA